MRIGVFGGFFNPPHIGHTHAIKSAAAALGLEKVLIIPSHTPPHKPVPPATPPPEVRLKMAALAAEEIDNAEACDVEISRGGVSYTCDTMRELSIRYPEDVLWLIVGSDMLMCIQKWRSPEVIFGACRIAALARKSGDAGNIYRHADVLRDMYCAEIDIIGHDPIDISSTELRRKLAEGDGSNVPLKVYEFIKANGLYRRG